MSKIIRKLARIFSRLIFGPDFMTFHLLKDVEDWLSDQQKISSYTHRLDSQKQIFNNEKMVLCYDID